MKLILRIVISITVSIAMIFGIYIMYLQINYYRIEDNLDLNIYNQQKQTITTEKIYTAICYNIGFGAYDHDFSFFMDKGKMNDGTEVKGISSRGKSYENVLKNTQGSIEIVRNQNADFYLLQEVDTFSTRSYFINQMEMYKSGFTEYANIYGNNFHSVYLFFPFTEPHGSVEAGLVTLSRYRISKATRRSYPVDNNFINKFFDLDRCFTIARIPTQTGKELILINNHMSAYDEGGSIRIQQLEMLTMLINEEYKKGNYVIVGGDYNHALCGAENIFKSEQQIPEWVSRMSNDDLPEGFDIVIANNFDSIPTCRSCDIAYTKGVNYTTILDGFIISNNVEATAENINTDFEYSDHNPVKLTFKLKEQ